MELFWAIRVAVQLLVGGCGLNERVGGSSEGNATRWAMHELHMGTQNQMLPSMETWIINFCHLKELSRTLEENDTRPTSSGVCFALSPPIDRLYRHEETLLLWLLLLVWVQKNKWTGEQMNDRSISEISTTMSDHDDNRQNVSQWYLELAWTRQGT